MSTSLPRGTLALTIDLEFTGPVTGLAQQRQLDGTVSQLLEALRAHKLPATWAVADPAVSVSRSRIEAADRRHELAIGGDASWVGRAAGRGRFARELTRRIAHARAEGVSVRSLMLKSDLPIEHCDLAIKEGIVAVRPAGSAARAASLPRTLRFGLWEMPVASSLPGESRWLPGGGGRRAACFQIDEAIQSRGLVQIAIDAPRLAERGASALRIVERVLEHAARRERHGLLDVTTLSGVTQHLAREHQSVPSRSILRPAA